MTADTREYRHLEGSGIYVWTEEHTEHLARRAADLGDDAVETLCDDVLAGDSDEDTLINVVDSDDGYRDWMIGKHA